MPISGSLFIFTNRRNFLELSDTSYPVELPSKPRHTSLRAVCRWEGFIALPYGGAASSCFGRLLLRLKPSRIDKNALEIIEAYDV